MRTNDHVNQQTIKRVHIQNEQKLFLKECILYIKQTDNIMQNKRQTYKRKKNVDKKTEKM